LPLTTTPAATPSTATSSSATGATGTSGGWSSAAPAAVVAARKTEPGKPPQTKPVAGTPSPASALKLAPASPPAASKAAAPTAQAQVDDKQKAGRTAGQSRLRLDPLVILADRVASLESSASVPIVEVQRESQRVQSLEGDVKALLALAAKNEANLLDMRLRLQKAESERLPAEWVYALVALVIACLALLAYFLSRPRHVVPVAGAKEDWWTGSRSAPLAPVGGTGTSSSAPAGLGPSSAPAPLAASGGASGPARLTGQAPEAGHESIPSTVGIQKSAPQPRVSLKSLLQDDPESQMDVSLLEMSPSNFDDLMQSNESHSAIRKGPLPPAEPVSAKSLLEPVRSINSEAIFDIRQQAEFFVSLGQTDQAVRILEHRINENGESSPLIYLDLLKIFHAMGLKSDFRQFREDFNLLFNGKVPEFAAFRDEGKDLEAYPHVLAHIVALWSTSKVLMVIEAAIFRDPWDDRSEPFELAAFRDLLLLHAIAQSNANPAVSRAVDVPVSGPTYFSNSGNAMAKVLGVANPALKTQAGFAQVPQRAAPLMVDLNLTQGENLDLELDLTTPALASAPAPVSNATPVPVGAASNGAMGHADAALPQVDGSLLDFDLPDPGAPGLPPTRPLIKPKYEA